MVKYENVGTPRAANTDPHLVKRPRQVSVCVDRFFEESFDPWSQLGNENEIPKACNPPKADGKESQDAFLAASSFRKLPVI